MSFPKRVQSQVLLLAVLLAPAPLVRAQQSALDQALIQNSLAGNAEKVAELLKQGANPNTQRTPGITVLHWAAKGGHLKVMRLLIDHGADVNARTRDGKFTPLVEAAGSREPAAVKLLLEAGAKPDGFELGQACWLGRTEAVKLLLTAGVNPDAGIVSAAHGGHVEIVRLLLERGANVNIKSKDGDTALQRGALQGGLTTVQLLLGAGADPNVADNVGDTPLHKAVSGDGDLARVKLLVAAGAKLDVPNKEGITPVRLAALAGRSRKPVYDWLLAAAGGKEPLAAARAPTVLAAKTTKELVAALSSENHETRRAAERELVGRGKEVMPDVLQSIESGNGIDRFLGLFAALGPQAEAALPKLEAALADKQQVFGAVITIDRIQPGAFAKLSRQSRERAAENLYEAAIDPEFVELSGFPMQLLSGMEDVATPYILKLLRSDQPEIRRRAASSLRAPGFASQEITAELVKLSQDDAHPAVRSAAATALGRFGEPSQEGRAALLAIIKRPPPLDTPDNELEQMTPRKQWSETADRAARSLARFGPSVIDDLLPLLTPMEAPQRLPAITVLQSIGASAVPRLIELLGHEDPAVAISASVALNRIHSPAVPALAKAVATGNDQVVEHAASALWSIGPGAKSALPALLEVAGSEEKSDVSRMAAARAALKIDPHSRDAGEVLSAVPVLIRILEKGSFKHQGWAAETAGAIGAKARDALPALRQRLELPAENADTGGLVPGYVQQQAKAAIAAIEGARPPAPN